MSEEFSRNLRENFSGKNHPFYGRRHSLESKIKMSMKRKGAHKGSDNSNWKDGKKDDGQGYVMIYCPNHPKAVNERYVYEHRLIMEKSLGRLLRDKEIVHHKNGIKNDNRLSNLELFENHSMHTHFHENARKAKRRKHLWLM